MNDMSGTIKEKVESNPMLMTVMSLGLGWLMVEAWNRREERSGWRSDQHREVWEGPVQREYYESEPHESDPPTSQPKGPQSPGDGEGRSMRQALDEARQRGGRYAEQAGQKVRSYGLQARRQAEGVKERAEHLTDEAHYRYRKARRELSGALQDNPLLVGVAAVAVASIAAFFIARRN